ncbi:hypothetical protein ACFO4N_10460 [Camelliibacillus cellulosilyticus]|uniref:Uncharacterized protein n=1 Tax=Camelliibacillus cellulosilyticus TaxID=2174486 RepID=A0ABV9GLV6_9BACL
MSNRRAPFASAGNTKKEDHLSAIDEADKKDGFKSENEYVSFNELSVNSLETNSGIFVGQNLAVGWRSFHKTNQGFGSAKEGMMSNMVNIIFDNDEIDTVIQENDHSEVGPIPTDGHQNIRFHSINANGVQSASGIAVGVNNNHHWRSHKKDNYGFGKAFGTPLFKNMENTIFDDDGQDFLLNPDYKQNTSF